MSLKSETFCNAIDRKFAAFKELMLKGRIVEVTKDAVIHRTMEYVRDAGIEIPMSPPPYAELRSFLSDLPGTSTLQVEYSFGIKIIRYDAKDGRYAI